MDSILKDTELEQDTFMPFQYLVENEGLTEQKYRGSWEKMKPFHISAPLR